MAGKPRSPARSALTSAGSSRRDARAATKDENQNAAAAVDAFVNERMEAAIRRDPDAVLGDFDWSKAVLVIPPKKKAISIRVDQDVLEFYKQQGAGYQRRMNAVLRSYMDQTQGAKKRKKRV